MTPKDLIDQFKNVGVGDPSPWLKTEPAKAMSKLIEVICDRLDIDLDEDLDGHATPKPSED